MKDCNRHICLKDLENYLRIDSYLANYTEVEQKLIRENIGALSELDLENYLPKCTPLLYSEFINLIGNNSLNVGHTYAITDFQTIYQSNVEDSNGIYQSWGLDINPSKIYTILVIAITPSNILNQVIILSDYYSNSNKWIAEYDYNSEVLPDGVTTKGKITYLKDNNNNTAYFDFKNKKSRRTKSELEDLGISISNDYLDLYTFNTPEFEEASELFNIHNNHFSSGAENNVFITSECYNNTYAENFKNNTFVSSCYNNNFQFNTQSNKSKYSVIKVTGSFNNLNFKNDISIDRDKQISKVDNQYVLSYIDPDTLTLQIYRYE